MRVLISGGGTGGHVYPLLVVAEALTTESGGVDILYVGSPGGMEASIVARMGLPYRTVDSGQIKGMSPRALLRNVFRLWRGYRQAKRLLAEWVADVVLTTGGYVSVPVAIAAWQSRVPSMVYLPDLRPGLAVRLQSRFVDRVAVSFEEVCRFFPGDKVWVSGYPVRSALLEADRSAGYRRLDLDPSLKTLLVLGGSRGARPLNRALMTIVPELLARYQIIHVSGQLDWPEVSRGIDQLSAKAQSRYRAYSYLHEELGAALAIADLVVARAGAATMAEFPAVGLPSVLVPYPYSGQHQALNADYMVAHGAAVRLDEAQLEAQLGPTVTRLLDDALTLERMGERARALSRPDAARRLAKELHRLARGCPASSDVSGRRGDA